MYPIRYTVNEDTFALCCRFLFHFLYFFYCVISFFLPPLHKSIFPQWGLNGFASVACRVNAEAWPASAINADTRDPIEREQGLTWVCYTNSTPRYFRKGTPSTAFLCGKVYKFTTDLKHDDGGDGGRGLSKNDRASTGCYMPPGVFLPTAEATT